MCVSEDVSVSEVITLSMSVSESMFEVPKNLMSVSVLFVDLYSGEKLKLKILIRKFISSLLRTINLLEQSVVINL